MSADLTLKPVPLPDESKLAWNIHGAFSAEECKRLIRVSDDLIKVHERSKDLGDQKNQFYGVHEETRAFVWQRLRHLLPKDYDGRLIVGLDDRIRFNSQLPGGQITPHFDIACFHENGDRSFQTLLVYLNDDFDGGCTMFFDRKAFLKRRRGLPGLEVRPVTGSAILFAHDTFHSGAMCSGGVKYSLRFDVVFSTKDRASSKVPLPEGTAEPQQKSEDPALPHANNSGDLDDGFGAGEADKQTPPSPNVNAINALIPPLSSPAKPLLIATRRRWCGVYRVDRRGFGEDDPFIKFPEYELVLFDDGCFRWTESADPEEEEEETGGIKAAAAAAVVVSDSRSRGGGETHKSPVSASAAPRPATGACGPLVCCAQPVVPGLHRAALHDVR